MLFLFLTAVIVALVVRACWRLSLNVNSGMGQDISFGTDWAFASLAVAIMVGVVCWPQWWWFVLAALGFYFLRVFVEWVAL
jgi:chromate transport protein ChrA